MMACLPEQFVIRINGRPETEKPVKIDQGIERVRDLIKCIYPRFYSSGGPSREAKLYTREGIELCDDDLQFLKNDDILYYENNGKEYDISQMLEQYKVLEKLGEGGFGSVFKAKHIATGEEVAIKYMDISEHLANAGAMEEIYRESKTLRMLNHKHIIKLHYTFVKSSNVVNIMEYASGGELGQYVKEQGGHLPELEARTYVHQICLAINSCHKRGVVHRDLKLENVLFSASDSRIVKVVDFGIAGMCKGNNKEETNAGTIRYMPPELHRGESTLADTAMDIWTIGIMMWLMLFGAYPFQGKSSSEIRKSIIEQELEFSKEILVSREARDLLRGMLNKSKERRYDMMRILTHKWFEVTEPDIEEQTAMQRIEIMEKEKRAQEKRMRSLKKEMLT